MDWSEAFAILSVGVLIGAVIVTMGVVLGRRNRNRNKF